MRNIYFANLKTASELSGLPESVLRSWDLRRILRPQIVDRNRRPTVRLYSFEDLVGLRVLERIRDTLGPDKLRQIQPWLKHHRSIPWETLRVAVHDGELRLSKRTGEAIKSPESGEGSGEIELVKIVESLRGEFERRKQRREADIGQISRRAEVLGNAWVISGTRIPTEIIWSFHEAGYDVGDILREYPQLGQGDVQAAIAHERELRKSKQDHAA